MRSGLMKSSLQLNAQVDDRIGLIRWTEDASTGLSVFDVEFNAFESGCAMRWLERRWSRPDLVGSCFLLQGNTLHLQMSQQGEGSKSVSSAGPISFEAWVRRVTRLADQSL